MMPKGARTRRRVGLGVVARGAPVLLHQVGQRAVPHLVEQNGSHQRADPISAGVERVDRAVDELGCTACATPRPSCAASLAAPT